MIAEERDDFPPMESLEIPGDYQFMDDELIDGRYGSTSLGGSYKATLERSADIAGTKEPGCCSAR